MVLVLCFRVLISLGFWGLKLMWCCFEFGRKKKAVHKTTTTDDKRLQSTLKRLGVNTIPGIEEVNIFKDETVIHFVNPKGTSSYFRLRLKSIEMNRGHLKLYWEGIVGFLSIVTVVVPLV